MSTAPTPAPSKPRVLRTWQTIALAVMLLAVAARVYESTRSKADVRVVHPSYQNIESSLSTTGAVVALHDFPARANFTGQVEAIYVHLGEKVQAGQMLLRMKDQYAVPRVEKARADLDDAQVNEQNVLHNGSQEDRINSHADLTKAQTELDNAAAALDAMQAIAGKGSVSGAEMDAAKQRLATAQASLDALNKHLTSRYSPQDIQSWKDKVAADKASLTAEKVSWANANISTPIAGTVYMLPTHLYDFVPAGTDLLHVADMTRIRIQANFEDTDINKLRVGEAATMTWDGAPGRAWHGVLQSKPLAVTRSGVRNVGECIVSVDDNHGDLPLDTNVTVTVVVDRHANVLGIPREALHTENGQHFVYRVEGGELKRTPVETGLSTAMAIEIRKGLSPKDLVVLHANNDVKLSDGLRVTTDK